jgi:hypothetical protein
MCRCLKGWRQRHFLLSRFLSFCQGAREASPGHPGRDN